MVIKFFITYIISFIFALFSAFLAFCITLKTNLNSYYLKNLKRKIQSLIASLPVVIVELEELEEKTKLSQIKEHFVNNSDTYMTILVGGFYVFGCVVVICTVVQQGYLQYQNWASYVPFDHLYENYHFYYYKLITNYPVIALKLMKTWHIVPEVCCDPLIRLVTSKIITTAEQPVFFMILEPLGWIHIGRLTIEQLNQLNEVQYALWVAKWADVLLEFGQS